MYYINEKRTAEAEAGLLRCLNDNISHLADFLLQLTLTKFSEKNLADLVNIRLQNLVYCPVYTDYTPLGYAIVQNDLQAVESLLQYGACIHALPCKPKDKNTCILSPLHLTLKNMCQPMIVDALLKKGASTKNIQSRDVSCLLGYIAKCPNSHTSEVLLSDMSSLNRVDNNKRTLLHLAAMNNNGSVVVRVLTAHQVDINQVDAAGKTALLYAAKQNSPNITQLLLDYGATVDLTDAWGRTALHFAVRKADLKTVELLISAGSNICAKDRKGLSPFSYAYSNDRILHSNKPRELVEDLVLRLLQGSIDDTVFSDLDYLHMTFILTKVCRTHEVIINLLNSHKMISSQRDANGQMLIHVAAEFGKHGVVRWLIEKCGVDPNISDDFGLQPLHHAAKGGNRKTFFYLLNQRDVDVNRASTSGWTPIWILVRNGWTDLACRVVRYGCDVTHTMTVSALQQADSDYSLRRSMLDTLTGNPKAYYTANPPRISLLRFATKCRLTELARLITNIKVRNQAHARFASVARVGKHKVVRYGTAKKSTKRRAKTRKT